MLDVCELRVHYGSVEAVRGVDIRVSPGEIVALVGANGAGKSSVLNAISGSVRAASGRVQFRDRDLTNQAPERIARAGISLVPEGRRIFGTLTVGENLRLGSRAKQREFMAQKANVTAMFPILADYIAAPAAVLSGGQQQQLAIARALLSGPAVMLLDEPSLGLDPLVTNVIFETLQNLRSTGLAVLLVEQNAHRAMEISDRTYVMKDGQMVHEGVDAEEARRHLDGAYFGQAHASRGVNS